MVSLKQILTLKGVSFKLGFLFFYSCFFFRICGFQFISLSSVVVLFDFVFRLCVFLLNFISFFILTAIHCRIYDFLMFFFV